ncbi:unnamed protein product [Rhizophagus irregularis]|nr:unnamed protein product [Rhizophagus irregularis]
MGGNIEIRSLIPLPLFIKSFKALAHTPSWFNYFKTHSLLPHSYSLPPELQTSSAHNFKGILITHPSLTIILKDGPLFWVDRFNSPYFGKIIKKDTIKKKIYVQHFLLSRQNNLTFFDPCHGHGSEVLFNELCFTQACDLSPKVLFYFYMSALAFFHIVQNPHSGDPWNKFIDSKCSEVHNNNNSSIITLLTDNMKNIHYTLNWNDIEVEQSPRKFIFQTSKVRGFEEFFNLARNIKYRRTNIDWKSTFEVLSGDDPSTITTFKSSRKKTEKIKFLMEELPTIEQMKKSLLDIYDNWLCPVCSDVIEDFNHIWSCICHVNILQKIVQDSQQFILTAINNNIKSDFCHVSLTDINSLDNFWDFSIDNNCLTFIDFIKGFIPITLSNYLKSLIFNDKIVCTIIGDLHDFTYNEVMNNIWKPRCELQVVLEKNLFITKKKKLDSRLNFSTNSSFNFINNANFSSVDYIENSLESLHNNIYFSRDILGFMLHVNYVSFINFYY